MKNIFERCEILIGKDNLKKLSASKIIIFGIGGVGGYIAEALVRTGIGEIHIVDSDIISTTNINRQIIADTKTIGLDKVEVMKKRLQNINPNCKIVPYKLFLTNENSSQFDFTQFDYVIDAIDTINSKLEIIKKADRENAKIISAMGAGNRLDPTKFEITDIYKTSICPLAKKIRYELKKTGIKKLKVCYSKEIPIKTKTNTIGSVSFCAPAMGLVIASEVVKDIIF